MRRNLFSLCIWILHIILSLIRHTWIAVYFDFVFTSHLSLNSFFGFLNGVHLLLDKDFMILTLASLAGLVFLSTTTGVAEINGRFLWMEIWYSDVETKDLPIQSIIAFTILMRMITIWKNRQQFQIFWKTNVFNVICLLLTLANFPSPGYLSTISA